MSGLKLGVIGNGFVGRAVVRGFLLHADVRVFDKFADCSHSLTETVEESDYIFLCLPTPMQKIEGGAIDLSIMKSVIDEILPLVRYTKKILVIKSTVVPGTTQAFADQYPDVRFCFCPEFLTARMAYLDFINPARIILGGPDDVTQELEEKVFNVRFPGRNIFRTDYTSAELAKYFANLFFATKVAFCNEMYDIVQHFGLNYDEIKEMVLADGRIGNSHFDVPGTDGQRGFGGTCFPKDLNAMIYLCKELGIKTEILEAVWSLNKRVRETWDWGKSASAVSNPIKG